MEEKQQKPCDHVKLLSVVIME